MNCSSPKVPRALIEGRIHPNNRKFLPEEVVVEEVSPFELLFHPKRFDVMIKYLYARERRRGSGSDWAKRMYLEHLPIIAPGVKEGDGREKQGERAFLDTFDGILDSIASGGFDCEKSVIPVNDEGVIVDGAHRLAACAVLNREVTVARPVNCHRHDYTSAWFLERGFSRSWADAAAAEYCRLNTRSHIALVWPKAVGKDRKIRDAIGRVGNIYYEKSVVLKRNGPANLIKLVYAGHPWIGTWMDGYKGSIDVGKAYFGMEGTLRVFVFDAPSADLVLKAKREIRDVFGIGNKSVHINDTHEESVNVSQALLHGNSVHFLNFSNVKEFDSCRAMSTSFRDHLAGSTADPDDFCVDSSMVLAAYGVREARDLDVLHHGHDDLLARCPEGMGSHNQEERHYAGGRDDVIFNPERHFRIDGVKYASLDVVCDMKQRRGEKKDLRDVELVRQFLEVGPRPIVPSIRDRARAWLRARLPEPFVAVLRRVRSMLARHTR